MVEDGSRLNGITLVDSGIRQEMNIIIVAIIKSNRDREMVFNPSSQTRIESGDTLIALGHITDLDRLAVKLRGAKKAIHSLSAEHHGEGEETRNSL